MRKQILCSLLLFLLISCSKKDDKVIEKSDAQTLTDSLVIELSGRDGKSVFDILIENHQIEYKSSPMGVFVNSIDSISNSSQLFWIYSVNDSMAKIAADEYITRNNDIIKWHLRRTGK